MKTIRLLPILLIIAVVVLFCSSSVFAATQRGDVTITFSGVPNPDTNPTPPTNIITGGNGGSITGTSRGSTGGSVLTRDTDSAGTTTIGNTTVPLSDTVSIVDPDIPLSAADFLGNLPKTGGSTLIPLLLTASGALLIFAAAKGRKSEI